MSLDIRVHKDRILLQNIKEEKKSLVLTSTDEESVLTGLILKVGKNVEDNKEGDKILYDKQHVLPIKYLGIEYFILREYDVIATI